MVNRHATADGTIVGPIELWPSRTTMSDFETLSQVLADASAELPTAEVHGLMSALVCVPGEPRIAVLHGEVLGPHASAPQAEGCRSALAEVWTQTLDTLAENDFTFEPLLPSDGVPLAERTLALGEWCTGYLAGLGLAGVKPYERSFSGEAGEFLHDLLQMSQIEPDPDANEDSEADYTELVEYVRIGVMLLREELELVGRENPVGQLH